jgi:HTH-type transcriptional regulator / antitoxin HigA
MATINQYIPQVAFHPGETLSEKLDELGMGPKEFAVRTGKPEKTIIAIIKGKSSITAEMAVQFEHVLKIPAHFWLNIQRSHDEFVAREERKAVLTASKGCLYSMFAKSTNSWINQMA